MVLKSPAKTIMSWAKRPAGVDSGLIPARITRLLKLSNSSPPASSTTPAVFCPKSLFAMFCAVSVLAMYAATFLANSYCCCNPVTPAFTAALTSSGVASARMSRYVPGLSSLRVESGT